jgi:RNA polymerase sigma-70 factor (ECF subfamily)
LAIRVTDLRTAQGDYKALDDRMLVLDFQAGHPEAFVEIHRRYSGLARHVCQRFLPNAHDADEALQETMIRVFQGLYKFNGRYALQPWIGRIATNVSLDAIRTRTRRPLVDDEAFDRFERVDPANGPEEAVERLIERDLVLSVLSGLPESHRTALVLRELEGRSHREIAEVMEMSPGQAKALIHRAKGSFRRRWLLAVTEKGGLSAIAALPLLWLLQATHLAKRVVDRVSHAGQVSQVATPEIVSTAASSPAVVATGAGFGERIVAAGMTLLVAGGVTVGAATIVKDRVERADRAEAPIVAPEVIDAPPLAPKAEVMSPPVRERVHRDRDRERVDPDADAPPPVVVPSPEPTVAPVPSPSPDPSPDPSPQPSPVPTLPPAPAWSYDFVSSTESVEQCTCDGSSRVTSQVERLDDGGLRFSQVVKGGVRDAAGDLTWPFYLQQWGEMGPFDGRLDYRIGITSAAGVHLYGGAAVLAETVTDADGSRVYRFEGTFSLTDPQSPAVGLPGRGFVTATLGVWSDGTIYVGSLILTDAPA